MYRCVSYISEKRPFDLLNPPIGLVATRIWYLNRSIMDFASHSYRPIMILVIESGAVYSVTLLTLLILYKAQSWFQYVLLEPLRCVVACALQFHTKNSTLVDLPDCRQFNSKQLYSNPY